MDGRAGGAVCSLWGRRRVAVVARAVAAVVVIGGRWSGHWGGVFVSFPEQGVDAPSRGWRAGESQAELGLQVLGKCSSEGPGWGGKEAMLLTCCSRLLNTREGRWYGRLIDCSVRKEQMNNARERDVRRSGPGAVEEHRAMNEVTGESARDGGADSPGAGGRGTRTKGRRSDTKRGPRFEWVKWVKWAKWVRWMPGSSLGCLPASLAVLGGSNGLQWSSAAVDRSQWPLEGPRRMGLVSQWWSRAVGWRRTRTWSTGQRDGACETGLIRRTGLLEGPFRRPGCEGEREGGGG